MKKGCLIALLVVGGIVAAAICSCTYTAVTYRKNHAGLVTASDARSAAERQVMAYKGSTAFGNTDQARELAKQLSTVMKLARQTFFSGSDNSKHSLSNNEFITYCNLLPDKCVFIVHVPQLRNYSSEAQIELAELTWRMASAAVRDEKLDVKELAVGIRGPLRYGQICTGTPEAAEGPNSGIKVRTTDYEVLNAFFELPPKPATK